MHFAIRTQSTTSQPRIDWLTLQRQNAEDTLVYTPQWLPPHESLKSFDAEGEFAQGEGALGAQTP